jgi:hypothetical protein
MRLKNSDDISNPGVNDIKKNSLLLTLQQVCSWQGDQKILKIHPIFQK